MPTFLSSLLSKPAIWIFIAITLAVIDLIAPSQLAICAVHALLLPFVWRFLHRRHVSLLTATLMVAVVVPGLVHLVEHVNAPSEATESVKAASMDMIDPSRVWATLTLAAAGLFHINLQRARRRRIGLRRELQQKVRRRTNEIRQVNQTLREEIDRRLTTQHLLNRSETNLQSLIDRMQLQVLRKDRDGVIMYANDTFCAQLGRDPADVIGQLDSNFYPAELAESYRADDVGVMESGQSVDHVEEHPAADGETGYVQVFKAPEYDEHGQCVGIQVIFWDITEKHRGAIALRDSEARKRALFETAGDAVLLTDRDQKIIEANPSAARLFLTPASQLVGRLLSEIAQPRQNNDANECLSWSNLQQAKRNEVTLTRSDGSTFDSEVSVHSIPMGNSEGMAIIVRDVTVQREAIKALREAKAAAEAISRTKSEFMAGVSHELRTPLGGITGLTDLLQQTPLSPRGRQYVDMIRQSGSQLSDVIEDILDFSAIEAGRVRIDPEPIDLHAVVGSAFKSLAARAVGKPLTMALFIDPDTPQHLIADPKRIRQIVMNLAGNALKFTPEGEVTLRLCGDPADGDDGTAAIIMTVADTGVGIPKDKQQTVFEAFERGEEGTTRRFGGTGLGLSITSELVRRMGGNIQLRSEVNVGSEFTCLLRLQKSSEVAAPAEQGCEFPFHQCVVNAGSDTIDQSISETLARLGILCNGSADNRSMNDPLLWVIAPHLSSLSRFPELRGPRDRVVWITSLGEKPPELAEDSDSILVQPVIPGELREAISGPVRDPSIRSGDERSGDELEDPISECSPASLRLLLVDDSPVNRTVIRDQLATSGYHIDVACGGTEAIEMAGQHEYDCILMDLQMPDMDGTEATRRIRKDYAQKSKTAPPTIALTAHVTEEHRKLCCDAGMEGFITKPIDREKLLLEIQRHTQDHAPSDKEETTPSATAPATSSWRDQLRSHSGSRPETLLAMCNAFLDEVPLLVKRLRAAVQDDDAAALRTASHTLKSCLAYVAGPEDVQRAAQVEANAKQPTSITSQQLDEIDTISEHWLECVKTLRDETTELIASSSS